MGTPGGGGDAASALLDALGPVLSPGAVVSVATRQDVKVASDHFRRRRQLKLGKRRVTWWIRDDSVAPHHNGGRHMEISRRDLLISLGVGSAALPLKRAPAADRPRPLRLGVIGAGSRGKELVRQFERVPGVSFVAACDVYQPRFAELASIARGPVEPFADYRKLLERRDLDAVAIATPIYLHREHVVATLDAGFPVYGEKSFGHTVADSDAILAAVERNKRPFQVGHQYRYATWFQHGRRSHPGRRHRHRSPRCRRSGTATPAGAGPCPPAPTARSTPPWTA